MTLVQGEQRLLSRLVTMGTLSAMGVHTEAMGTEKQWAHRSNGHIISNGHAHYQQWACTGKQWAQRSYNILYTELESERSSLSRGS